MGRIGVEDLEDLRTLRLDDEGRDELLSTQNECKFIFAGRGRVAVGVVMSFCTRQGADAVLLTATLPAPTREPSSTTRG